MVKRRDLFFTGILLPGMCVIRLRRCDCHGRIRHSPSRDSHDAEIVCIQDINESRQPNNPHIQN